jgi:hypothetical protein
MADPIIPTPQDTQLLLQNTTTQTASFNTGALDLGSGYSPGGTGQPVVAVVNVTALDTADGNESYTVTLQESADNSAWAASSPAVSIAATGGAVVRGHQTKRYVRLAFTIGGTTPSITLKAWLNPLP